jgi:hypothetical protein
VECSSRTKILLSLLPDRCWRAFLLVQAGKRIQLRRIHRCIEPCGGVVRLLWSYTYYQAP